MHPLWLVYFLIYSQRRSLWLLTQWKFCIFKSIETHNSWFEAHLREKRKPPSNSDATPSTYLHGQKCLELSSMHFFVFSHCDSWYTVILDIIKHHTRQDKTLSYLSHVVWDSSCTWSSVSLPCWRDTCSWGFFFVYVYVESSNWLYSDST